MSKQDLLDLLKLLSALESWSFSNGQRMPDYLIEKLDAVILALEREILKP